MSARETLAYGEPLSKGEAERSAERAERVAPSPVSLPDVAKPTTTSAGAEDPRAAFDWSAVVPSAPPPVPPVPPRVRSDAPLKLDLEARERRPGRQLSIDTAPSPYPELSPKRRRGKAVWLCAAFVVVAVALFVAALGGSPRLRDITYEAVAGIPWLGQAALGPLELFGGVRKRAARDASAEELEKCLLRTDVPECWQGDEGFFFIYPGKGGEDVVVERISQVPKHLRKRARCVNAAH